MFRESRSTGRAYRPVPYSLLVVLIWALCFGVTVAHAAPPKHLGNKLEKIIKRAEKVAGLSGASVVSIEDNESWYDKNGQVPLFLASNAKLISTAAVLRKLGGDHRFETQVRATVNERGIVEDSLYLVGGGDPKLMAGDFKALAQGLKKKGVHAIQGSVIVDDSLFDTDFLPPKFDLKNTDAAYRASVGALGVNYNAVAVSFKAANVTGGAPAIRVSPSSAYPLLDNRATTVKGKKDALVIKTSRAGKRTRIRVEGRVGVRNRCGSVRRRIDDPGIFAGYVFLSALQAAGIKVADTKVKRDIAPADLPVVLKKQSLSLAVLARDTNEWSNNMMAEMLFKALDIKGGNTGATWEGAQEGVEEMLSEARVPVEDVVYVNGSGLYEADKMSPKSMTTFLAWAFNQEGWGQEWRKTLAVGGKTGTLRGRMRGGSAQGNVQAKTGTLDNVIALSGYVQTRTKGVLAFSFLFNDVKSGRANYRKVRRAQDALCEALANL